MAGKKSRSGFSTLEAQEEHCFNPSDGFASPNAGYLHFNPSVRSVVAQEEHSPKTISPFGYNGKMMSQRIGIHTVKILNVEETADDPLREQLEGTLHIQGEEWRFGTKIQGIKPEHVYSAVCERRKTAYGDPIIEIHELDELYGKVEMKLEEYL